MILNATHVQHVLCWDSWRIRSL